MSSISGHTNTAGIPPTGPFVGVGDTKTTQAGTTTKTQEVKSSLSAINDFVESLKDTLSTQGIYLKDPNQPEIPMPNPQMADGTVDDQKEKTFRMPYGRNEKTVILQDFKDAIKNELATFVKSLNLPEEDAAALLSKLSHGFVAMSSNKEPQLTPPEQQNLQNIVKQTTEQIQKQYGLQPTWKATSPDPTSWTPVAGVKTNGVDPIHLSNVVAVNGVKANLADMKVVQNTVQTLMTLLPKNSPDIVTMKDFLTVIQTVLQHCKEFLFYAQSKDAERDKKTQEVKYGLIESQIAIRSAQMDNMKVMMAMQKSMGVLGTVIKVIGPILSAAMVAISAALCVAGAVTSWLMGAGLVVIAIGLILGAIGAIIGTIATAYSIVDSCTNCTQLALKAFDNLIKQIIQAANKGEDIPWLRGCIEAGIIIALIAPVAIALLVCTLAAPQSIVSQAAGVAGAATEAATMTVAQILRAIILEIIEQISMQIVMSVIVPAITDLAGHFAQDIGLVKLLASIFKCDETTASMVIQICVTAFTMLIVLALSLRGGKNAAILNKGINAARTEAQNASTLMKMLRTLSGSAEKNGISVANILGNAKKGLELTTLGFKVSSSIANGVICIQMAQLHQQKGEYDSAQEALQGAIDVLTKVVKDIESQISSEGSLATSLTNMQVNMYKQYSKTISQMFS